MDQSKKSSLLVHFGLVVRERRLMLSLTQEELAAAAGLHRTYVGMIERYEKNITLINAERLAIALDCKLSDLLNAA